MPYIQIGVTALRNEDGTFQPSRPLYIKTEDKVKESGLTQGEEDVCEDISKIFADKIRQYKNGIRGLPK